MGSTSIYVGSYLEECFIPAGKLQIVIFISLLLSCPLSRFVDDKFRNGEPRICSELNAEYDAKIQRGPWGLMELTMPIFTIADPSRTSRMRILLGLPLDLAVSGESDLLGLGEEQ